MMLFEAPKECLAVSGGDSKESFFLRMNMERANGRRASKVIVTCIGSKAVTVALKGIILAA